MKLRVFLPAIERPTAGTRFAWMLLESRQGVLREGESVPEEMPRAGEVEAVLPSARVLFARLKLPRVNAATIRELLPFAVEDRLLADPSHIHAVAGHKDAKGDSIVAVVDREWLQAMLDALARAGLRPQRAWPESCLLAGGHDDWNLVWSPTRGMLVDDDGVSATFDHDASRNFPLALRLALDEAAARGNRPVQVRVHIDADAPLPDLERWSAETGVSFAPGTQWRVIARGEPSQRCTDLLEGEFAPRSARRLHLPRAAVVIAAAVVLLQVAFVAVDTWRLERERSALEARSESIFRAAFPEAKAVVDPALQMKRNLGEMRRARGLSGDDDFLAGMTRAAREGRAPAKSIQYANGKLEVVSGTTFRAESRP